MKRCFEYVIRLFGLAFGVLVFWAKVLGICPEGKRIDTTWPGLDDLKVRMYIYIAYTPNSRLSTFTFSEGNMATLERT